MTASLHLGRRSRRPDASAMKLLVIAPTAAIAAVLVLAGIGCNAQADQPPAPTPSAQPAAPPSAIATAVPTSRPALEAITPPAAQAPSLDDRLAAMDMAMAGIMLGEFPDAEEMAEQAMDSSLDSGDLESGAISAVPAEGAVDDQGNLSQPELGDPLIDFTLPRAGGGEITLSEIGRDQYTVLVFYRAFW